jgi:glycine/D-amino acid oxidase-like deaminating enzyme
VKYRESEGGHHVENSQSEEISGDRIIFAPGAAHFGFLSEFTTMAPLRRVFLQMGATVPIADSLGHSLADADSLRYYPAFKDLSLDRLPSQSKIAHEHKMQLLLAPRLDGSFTIGDTHLYDEPFSHEIIEEPYEHLLNVINSIFGREFSIGKRWSGIYSQSTSTTEIYYRNEIAPGATIVSGVGGRGNTISPAVAEETFQLWEK